MREDLELWDYAVSLGYSLEFSDTDIRRKRTTKEEYPHDSISFKKGDILIWEYGQSDPEPRTWWQARNTINGRLEPYETRRIYDTLKEALDNE